MRTLIVCLLPLAIACDKIPGMSEDSPKPAASPATAPSATAPPSAVATASVAPTASSSQDKLSDFPPVSYATYTNPRFNFAVQHPTFMSAQPPPENGDGQTWMWSNRATMKVWGFNNVNNETVEDFCKEAAKRNGNKQKIVNNGACLVSGSYNGKAYWQKTHFVGDKEISILLEYDETFRTNFDPIIHQVAVTIRLPPKT